MQVSKIRRKRLGPERTREDQRGPERSDWRQSIRDIYQNSIRQKKSNIPPVPDMLVFSKSMLHVERRFTQIIKGYI